MAVAFAGFGVLAARKLAILRKLAPEPRLDHPLARLRTVLVNGFLQSRMIRREWKPGVMHTAIFLGFMTLLVRKLQLIAIGYYEPARCPGPGRRALRRAEGRDRARRAARLRLRAYRRLVQKPRRLERNREALLVLSLIVAIMVTDYAFDAFRFALMSADRSRHCARARRSRSWAARSRRRVAPLSAPALRLGYHASYWLQLVVVFSFLVILPIGEHFHIVTALPALFFRRGRPANAVPTSTSRRRWTAATTARCGSACAARAISPGRKGSTPSRARNAAAARTRARRSSPASRCRRSG